MDESIVKIQATISGYSGMPCSLLSAYYRDSGILVIVKIHAYSSEPIKDSSVITNVPRISRSAFFAESDMKKAIQAFKTLSGKIAEDGTALMFRVRNSRLPLKSPMNRWLFSPRVALSNILRRQTWESV